ncbi:MAG: hypothetical protein WCO44_03450 [Bacteroidota bacterium]
METQSIYLKLRETLEADIDRNERIERLNNHFSEMIRHLGGAGNQREARSNVMQKHPELNIMNGYFQANHRLIREGYLRDVSRKTLDALAIAKLLSEFWKKVSGEEIPSDLQACYSSLHDNYDLRISLKSIDTRLATVILENQNNRLYKGIRTFVALTVLNAIFVIMHFIL